MLVSFSFCVFLCGSICFRSGFGLGLKKASSVGCCFLVLIQVILGILLPSDHQFITYLFVYNSFYSYIRPCFSRFTSMHAGIDTYRVWEHKLYERVYLLKIPFLGAWFTLFSIWSVTFCVSLSLDPILELYFFVVRIYKILIYHVVQLTSNGFN